MPSDDTPSSKVHTRDSMRCRFCQLRAFWRVSLALAAAVSLTFPGCKRTTSGGSSTGSHASGSSAGTGTPASVAPKPINLEKPVVVIVTSLGAITLELDGLAAPGTVRNFLNYASEGFYDNTLVHYVDSGKMIVAGGYAAD